MDTRLVGKRLALGWFAASVFCAVGIAGETGLEPAAKADDAAVSQVTEIKCKPRKRTSEFWAPVGAARANQEWNQHKEGACGKARRPTLIVLHLRIPPPCRR